MSTPEALIEYVGEVEHEGALNTAIVPRQKDAAVALPAAPSTSIVADPYMGVAALPFDERAQTALQKYQDVPDEWIDVKPDGKLYLSHIKARNILNEAFGYGGWALVPVGDSFQVERVPFTDRYGKEAERVNVYRIYRLYINGRFIDEAMGAGTYYTNNAEADYSDACESAKSYALNRLCKTFNIAQKCWSKSYQKAWLAKYATQDGKGHYHKKDTAGSVVGNAAISDTQPAKASSMPDQHDDAPTTHTPTRPADPSPSSSDDPATAKIKIASVGPDRKQKNGRVFAYVKDTEGREWSFLGEGAVAAARIAEGSDMVVRVTYTVNGKYKNVSKVEDAQ